MKSISPAFTYKVGSKRPRNEGFFLEQDCFNLTDGGMKNDGSSSLNETQITSRFPYESNTYTSEVMDELRAASKKLNEYHQNIGCNSNGTQSLAENEKYRPEIDFIPSLVNKIVEEISSTKKKSLKTVELTQALLQLILDFVEPLFYDSSTKSEMEASISSEKNQEEEARTDINLSENHENQKHEICKAYKLRGIDWAIARISDLLQPSNETEIPELEALLAATGPRPHDLSFETQLQNNILKSMETMEKYMIRNNKKGLDLCSGLVTFIDCKRNDLVSKRKLLLDEDQINRRPRNPSEQNDYDLSWSRNPLKWFHDMKTGAKVEKSEYKPVMSNKNYTKREIAEEFPFLYQMQDFLQRHEKEEKLEVILQEGKK